jgi:hypothetical protein
MKDYLISHLSNCITSVLGEHVASKTFTGVKVTFTNFTAEFIIVRNIVKQLDVTVGSEHNTILLDPDVFNADNLKLKAVRKLLILLSSMCEYPMALLVSTYIRCSSDYTVYLPYRFKYIPISFYKLTPTTPLLSALQNAELNPARITQPLDYSDSHNFDFERYLGDDEQDDEEDSED